ncbi:hypothetical protein CBG46_01550 [Actinobacillus succinogenes]|uniref:DUF8095 domain-containing protein n=1 Tax=Actinobacillus succinogenes (strain ATCC 55618 / DSM 22257 / CCUG 43843 / 130Z) TaxID=339671 RepID=A6VMB9_ACTSZ|nr:hypothetical protein [Actinobacillus succinogenes]ABR74116.1 conserved hypothetical protein [Actinobacillus succinogenes 130Z]PHI39451.1 hypothetical protein CBG46_01550 [Actinobacillus succinogenes]
MKCSNIVKNCLILTALSGCATSSDFANPAWRPFKDIDGSVREISFYSWKVLETKDGKHVERDSHVAYLAKPLGENLKAKQKIGEMYPLGQAGENSAMATIFLLDGKSLNIYDEPAVKALAQAKTFDFYEFGGMRLSHARFTAKKAICRDFKGKTGVDLLMTTNYYPRNSFTDFYTALINVNLRRDNAPKEIGYTPSFTGSDTTLQHELKTEEAKQGKNIALLNIQEKASILFNIICK